MANEINKINVGGVEYEITDLKALQKITSSTTYHQAYIKYADGTQGMINLSDLIVSGALIFRNSTGQAEIATPTSDNQIANKSYVDNNHPKVIR